MTRSTLRTAQLLAVVAGVGGASLAVGGGVLQWAPLAMAGVGLFAAALATVVGLGIFGALRVRD